MSGELVKEYGPGGKHSASAVPVLKHAPVPDSKTAGRRPSIYRPELALAICERLAAGETLRSICKDIAFPTEETFRKWAMNNDVLREAFRMAKELKAHTIFDEALDMAREIRDMESPTAQKVRAFDIAMTHLRWAAGKLHPQDYGERSAITTVVPIQINTTLDLGKGPVPEAGGYTIEAVLTEVPEDPKVLEAQEKRSESARKAAQARWKKGKREAGRADAPGRKRGRPPGSGKKRT